MSYKPQSLFRIIEQVNTSLFLPHIQRPFVWDEDQMERLFDSLMRNYPIQTFLFWRTNAAIKARRFMASIDWDANLHDLYDVTKSVEGVEKVFVLDGQQRLQTLFALFSGSVKSSDEKSDREAFFDVRAGLPIDDEQVIYPLIFSETKQPLPYFRLRDLLGSQAQRNAEEIADDINDALNDLNRDTESAEERSKRQRRVRRNIAQVVSLLREEKYFWIQELDGVASEFPYRKVLDIFVRVNSGGTKLSAADLMFAAMKESWAEVEENIEEIVDMLNNENRLNFDKNLVLKCISTATGNGAELGPDKFVGQAGTKLLDDLKERWEQLEDAFKQLRDFVVNELRLYGDKVVRSYNAFIPVFDYLYNNPRPDEKNRALMRGYYYKSQMFNWYSARTDNLVNTMHGLVGKASPAGFPIDPIKRYFADSIRASVELTSGDLNMRLRYILLNLIYVEKFGASPFNVRYQGNEPHIDHIYPQSMLRSQLGMSSYEINDLGNYRLVGAVDNMRKRAEAPASYFQRLKGAGIDIEKHLLLPYFANDPAKLEFTATTYRDFRDRRREAIFAIANRVVNPELI
jgi:hypothetical protein